jgi:uncharacterized protein YgiM (DUF1202 family)
MAAPARAVGYHVLATTRLNLRSCPGTNCDVIETLSPQTDLLVTGNNGDWLNVQVTSANETGWVYSSYVSAQTAETPREADGVLDKVIYKFAPILLFGGVLFGLGYSGLVFRRGSELKRALVTIKEEAEKQGKQVNDLWQSNLQKANRRTRYPILFWGLVYSVLFYKLPVKEFVVSLAGFVLPILGYFGFLIGPSFDANDLNLDS